MQCKVNVFAARVGQIGSARFQRFSKRAVPPFYPIAAPSTPAGFRVRARAATLAVLSAAGGRDRADRGIGLVEAERRQHAADEVDLRMPPMQPQQLVPVGRDQLGRAGGADRRQIAGGMEPQQTRERQPRIVPAVKVAPRSISRSIIAAEEVCPERNRPAVNTLVVMPSARSCTKLMNSESNEYRGADAPVTSRRAAPAPGPAWSRHFEGALPCFEMRADALAA